MGFMDSIANFFNPMPPSIQNARNDGDTTPTLAATSAQNFSAQQAQITRDWQTEMSNTAWQRGVADMKKAGINPIAAYSAAAASTPSGATGQAFQANTQTSAQKRQSDSSAISNLATSAFMLGKML